MKSAFPRLASLLTVTVLLTVVLPAPASATAFHDASLESNRRSILLQATTVTPTTQPPPPTETSEPQPIVRPQISVQNYRTKPENLYYGQNFDLIVKLRNEGEAQAFNVQATFASSDFVPLRNGGVNIVGDLVAGNSTDINQPMTVANYVFGIVSVTMNLSYSDVNGAIYTEIFTLNIRVSGGSGVAAATATPTGVKSSQLVITSYATSVDPLQPGEQFTLTMTVENTGNVGAQRVTMIVGGGSSSGGSTDGTPQAPGGVSGGSGEFTNFAPVGASNVQTLGDLPERGAVQARQAPAGQHQRERRGAREEHAPALRRTRRIGCDGVAPATLRRPRLGCATGSERAEDEDAAVLPVVAGERFRGATGTG